MKNKLSLILFFATLFLSVNAFQAQKIWSKQEKSSFVTQKKNLYQKKNFPSAYKIVSLDKHSFENRLKSKSTKKKIIELPNADGNLSRFIIKETSNFDEKLQAKFPNIKSYSAQGIDDPTAVAKISVGTDGFHAVIFSGKQGTVYIDPYSRDNKDYIVYKRNSLSKLDNDFKCQVEASAKKDFSISSFAKNADDGKLRTFRLALACTGEYAQFHLGASQQNIPTSATDQEKKTAILSAMNTSLTRINGVFEKDLSVKMVLVSNNDDLIFFDPDTDGMSDASPGTLINEIQTICDNQIGNANYDIGHVYSTSGGSLSGVASLAGVCVTGQKARGVTGLGNPVGDPYDIDLVAHEIGHQFGATHTFNNSCNDNRTNLTAVEPGSGSTIMGYAGICSPNVLSVGSSSGNSDDHFHAVSIAQMWNIIQTSGNCGTITDTNNTAPTANAGLDYSIPKSTPFKLTGEATDADGVSSLTYNWEQLDNELGTMPPTSTNDQGPMFRSLPSKIIPVRYMPDLSTVISGSVSSTWEVVPSVAREMNFSFTVRDNNVGGGSTARDDMKIDVIDVAPFLVSAPNSAVSWDTGSTQTITWDKGGTDASPINCSLVNIKLSTDGGLTFPFTLKSNTPNDGTEEISIPDNPTSSARIMVEAVDNIFYNVNSTNFTIRSTASTFVINNTNGLQLACNSGDETVSYNLNFDFVNGFSETVTLSATGQPTGSAITFSSSTINTDGDIVMTISDLNGKTVQDYEINVRGTSTSVTQNIKVDFKLVSSQFNTIILTSPANGSSDASLKEKLNWNADTNATSYIVEVANDANFSNIVSSDTVDTNSYITDNLVSVTQYFWRVKPKNKCGEGVFSDTFNFTTEQAVYCSSTFTDEASGTEHILNVTFGDINNDSDNDTSDGYQDFTSISTLLFNGQEKQISVTYDTAGFQDHCYVFIDWNQDFEFDNETERYDLGTRTEDIATATLNITVPSDAKSGNTRMRVILEYDDPDEGFGEGACDSDHLSEWGETEDYTLMIDEPLGANNFIIKTISETCENQNDGIIIVDVINTQNTNTINIVGGSTNISQNITGKSFQLSDLEPGNYEICISTTQLNTTHCFEVVIEEAQQIALKVASKNQSNIFSFEIFQGTSPYKVFLNDELIGMSSSKNFDLNINGNGVLKVKTALECEGIYEKNLDDLLSTNSLTKLFTVVKNPVTDFIELNLSSNLINDFIEITIFDITGKLIYHQKSKVISDKLKIPFSSFAKGIYILKPAIKYAKPIKILKQ